MAALMVNIVPVADTASPAIERALLALATLPERAINAAHAVIEAEIPVYTATYQKAVTVLHAPGRSQVGVSEAGLLASAGAHKEPADVAEQYEKISPRQYVYGIPEFTKSGVSFQLDLVGEGPPYPQRIEAAGSPIHNEGQGMWEAAAAAAEAVLTEALAAL